MNRRKLVVGNWKMNGLKEALGEARAIFAAADTHPGVDVALCPPFTLIGAMAAGHVDRDDFEAMVDYVSLSEYPLSGATAINRLLGAIEAHRGIS